MILSQSNATAALNAMVSDLGASASIAIYNGTAPAGPDTALSGNTLLVSGVVSSWGTAAYDSAVSGMASVATMTSSAYAPTTSGTATFARILTSGSVAKQQLTVGTSGTDVILGNTSIQTGVNVDFTSVKMYVPSQSV